MSGRDQNADSCRSSAAADERRRVAPYHAVAGSLRAKHELVRAQLAPDFVTWVLDPIKMGVFLCVADRG